MVTPGPVVVDIAGLRGLSEDLRTAGESVAAVVRTIDQLPAPRTETYGEPPAVTAMDEVVSAWSEELTLLRRFCNRMSEAAQETADGWHRADQEAGYSFDLFRWPDGPENDG